MSDAQPVLRTCLVADDSSVIRKVARRILEDLNFHVVEAADGEEALKYCIDKMPEAILLDWNMPVMDGYEFLMRLRKETGGDRPRVVFCATENDVSHIAKAMQAGANEYMMKPFDRFILRDKFKDAGLVIDETEQPHPPLKPENAAI